MTTRKYIASVLGAGALILTQVAAHAAIVNLTFEGLQNLEPINNYYNGGLGGMGSGPGPNYGISFTSDSLALIASSAGGTGNFANNPSGGTVAFFLSGLGDTMSVSSGFNTGFSFYYAAAQAGSVTVYSGVGGTGSVLANLALPVTPNPYDSWVPIGVSFSGTAQSVVFSGAANYIGFDNITLGTDTPVIPEPSTWAAGLLLIGVTGSTLLRRRQVPV